MYDIELTDVSVYYDRVCALDNVNLKIREKEFLTVIGPNGGGKTTLLKVILGLIKPKSGTVNIKDNKTLGYVPQFTSFDKHFPVSVLEVVLMGCLGKKIIPFHRYTGKDIEKTELIMQQLGIYQLKDRQIGQLSGGQLQKVLIARALASEPKILILDEPTASLDSNSKSEIYELLKKLNEEITVIVVSHDLIAVSSYVHSIACLNKKLFYHGDSKLSEESINKVYGCPVDLIAHGFPHRVFRPHKEDLHD